MTAIAPITDEASYRRAQDRLHALMDNWNTRAEFDEGRALAEAIEHYSDAHFHALNVHTDAADELEFLLDMENTNLEQLDALLGGRDALIEIMTRTRRLSESEVDRLAARLKVDWEDLDREIHKPEGWRDIDIPEGPTGWRAELLAHRDAKAAESAEGTNTDIQDMRADARPREPELAATL